MAFQIIPIIQLLSKSGTIASTLDSLFKQYKRLRNDSAAISELQKVVELQDKINGEMQSQIELINKMIIEVHKSFKVLSYLCFTAVAISAAAIIISLIK